jgi:hypothetical protein
MSSTKKKLTIPAPEKTPCARTGATERSTGLQFSMTTIKSPQGKKEVCTGALINAIGNKALSEMVSITVPPNLEEADTSNSAPGLPDCLVAQSNDAISGDTLEILAFEVGVHYPLVEGRLYFSCHPDEAYTCEAINRDRFLFYLSSIFPGMR